MATSQKLKDDFLTCHICMEIYQQPSTLNCEHTYCQGCLTKYIKSQSDAIKAKYIPCPSCRRHIPVPHPDRPVGEWAGQFRPGLVIQGLMDSLAQGNPDTDSCSVCREEGETTAATHWCSECEASLCDTCLKYHNKMPISRHHEVSYLSGETTRVQRKKRKFVCKKHDKKIKLFCKDCRKTLCTICCSIDHRACKDVVTIQEMLPEVKQELTNRQKKIQNDIDQTSKQITKHKKKVDDFIAKSTTVKTEIKQTFQNAYKMLQQKERQLMDKVDDITDKQTGELKAKVKAEEITTQLYQQQSQFIQQALTFEDEAQLYEMYLSSESEVVADTQADSGNRPDVTDISFTHNMEKLREDIDMMDVRIVQQPVTATVCDDVIDLTATPVLHEIVEIEMEGDMSSPDLRDVVVLNINGMKTIVVTDWNNNSIKSVYVNNGKTCNSKLKLDRYPWSLTVLKENNVVVTVPLSRQILTVSVNPDLVLLSTITTNKGYWGLAVLDQSTLVAGSNSPPSVDVLDMTGNVLRSFTTLPSIQKTFKDPRYLHVTNQGNILVSDNGLKSVICLTPTGEVVFHYTPTGDRALRSPYGITSTTRGDILVADFSTHKVVHITESGQYVQDILTSQNGLMHPLGLCVDGNKLYVAMDDSGVHVFKFSQM